MDVKGNRRPCFQPAAQVYLSGLGVEHAHGNGLDISADVHPVLVLGTGEYRDKFFKLARELVGVVGNLKLCALIGS
jgi:hypothetical protein